MAEIRVSISCPLHAAGGNSWRGPATLGANGRAHLTHCQASSSSSAASGIRTASLDRVGRAPTAVRGRRGSRHRRCHRLDRAPRRPVVRDGRASRPIGLPFPTAMGDRSRPQLSCADVDAPAVDVRRRDRPSCRVEDLDRSTLIRKDRGRSRLPRVNVEGLTARGERPSPLGSVVKVDDPRCVRRSTLPSRCS